MRGSQLDSRITLQSKVATQDPDYGTETVAWEIFGIARMPASVQDTLPSKSESAKDGVRVATQPARVRIRYLAGITSDMRLIVHGEVDRTMQIVAGPAIIGRREWLEFMVEEYSTTGDV